jgi:hypothetical protein
MTTRAFFLFGDGDIHVESTAERLSGWMEAIDVRNGEYDDGIFDDTGRRYEPDVVGEEVRLVATDEIDLPLLLDRLREFVTRAGLAVEPVNAGDPVAIAAIIAGWEWDDRWPKRPRWLSRLIHGDRPTIGS